MLEALLSRDMDKYFGTMVIDEPSPNDTELFQQLISMLDGINDASVPYMDTVDSIARALLTQKKLNDEICKLIVMLCDNYA